MEQNTSNEFKDLRTQRGQLNRVLPPYVLELIKFAPFPARDQGNKAVERSDFKTGDSTATAQRSNFNITASPPPDFDVRSILGTPIPYPITIDGYQLPGGPLVRIQQKKKIIKTDVAGRNGTFKELISMGDYDVIISYWAFNEGRGEGDVYRNSFPQEVIRRIREIVEANKAVSIDCEILSWFNISEVVIESADYAFTSELVDAVPYQIKCVSNQPFELELIDETA